MKKHELKNNWFKKFQNRGAIIDKGSIYVVIILTMLIFGGFMLVGGTLPTKLPKPSTQLVDIVDAPAANSQAGLQLYSLRGVTHTPVPTLPKPPSRPSGDPVQINCGDTITGNTQPQMIWALTADNPPTAASNNQPALKAFYTNDNALLLGSGAVTAMTKNPADTATNPSIGDANARDAFTYPFFPSLFITDITTITDAIGGDAKSGGQPNKPDMLHGTWKALEDDDPEENYDQRGAIADPWPPANGPGGPRGTAFTSEIIWPLASLRAVDPATGQQVSLTGGKTYRIQVVLHNGSTPEEAGVACFRFTMPTPADTPPRPQGPAYYVATNGNDSHSCTAARNVATPKRTIASGLSCLSAGDTLYIRGGTYNEKIRSDDQFVPSGTSWSNAITIASYPGETATLMPSSGSDIISLNAYSTSADIQYIIFDRLILDARNTRYAISWIGNPSAFNTHHIRFQDGEIKNSMGTTACQPGGVDGVNIQLSGHHHEFLRSKSHSARCSYGFYISGHDILLDGMEVFNNNRYGIQIFESGSRRVNNNIVRNSRIYGNGYAGMTINSGSNNQAYNNLIYNNAGGIEFGLNGIEPNTQIYNNTIYNNTSIGIQIGKNNQSAKVQNNIVYSNRGGDIVNHGSTSTTLSNNLLTDPQFVNSAANDFHLQSTSPAIDAGIALSIVATDFSGISRPQGTRPDIGAYEYQSLQLPP